jgi:hypothetical protein
MSKNMYKHAKLAMQALIDENDRQVDLADVLFDAIKRIESEGNYTKGEEITQEDCKDLVEGIVERAKNFVNVKKDRKSAVRSNSKL